MVQVPTGIISQLEHPPYGALTRETGPTLTTGLWQIQRIRGPVNFDAFGVSYSFITIPTRFGYSQRVHKDYEVPIVALAPLYTMFDGHDVYGPTQYLTHEGDLIYLDQLLPKRVDVWVQVGCTVTMFFLLAL